MRLLIEHRTVYRFTEPQRRLIQLLKVVPPSFDGQSVIDWHVTVDRDARLKSGRDGYGNETMMLYVDGPLDGIVLTVSGEVATEDRAGMVANAPEPLPPLLFTRTTAQTEPGAAIAGFARAIGEAESDPLARLHALNTALNGRIAFDPGDGNPHRDAAQTFADGHGVCQDHAHVFIAAARILGHPARYVSGHLWRADGAAHQPATHAWAEAHVDGYGWIGFDPANGVCPTAAYVRVATGLDYRDAAPISGARVGGGGEELAVDVVVSERAGPAQRQSQGGSGEQQQQQHASQGRSQG